MVMSAILISLRWKMTPVKLFVKYRDCLQNLGSSPSCRELGPGPFSSLFLSPELAAPLLVGRAQRQAYAGAEYIRDQLPGEFTAGRHQRDVSAKSARMCAGCGARSAIG